MPHETLSTSFYALQLSEHAKGVGLPSSKAILNQSFTAIILVQNAKAARTGGADGFYVQAILTYFLSPSRALERAAPRMSPNDAPESVEPY
jgi:hypothetical protein